MFSFGAASLRRTPSFAPPIAFACDRVVREALSLVPRPDCFSIVFFTNHAISISSFWFIFSEICALIKKKLLTDMAIVGGVFCAKSVELVLARCTQLSRCNRVKSVVNCSDNI